MMSKIKLDQIVRHPMVVGTSIVFGIALIATWIGLWQLLCVAGIVGGGIAGVQKARHGFIAGVIGGILAWVVYLNTSLWEDNEIWDIFLQIVTGIEGLGMVGIVLALMLGGLISGMSGYFGAALLEYFQVVKEAIYRIIVYPEQQKNEVR